MSTLAMFDRGDADISECGLYRYSLRRPLGGTRSPLVFVMLNPSTADATTDDPTLRRCLGFGRRALASEIRIVNLFAFRTPYPAELRAARDRGADVVGPRNPQVFDALSGVVICAWGPPKWPFVRQRAQEVVEHLARREVITLCLGTSKDGSPRHPLMVRNDVALELWVSP